MEYKEDIMRKTRFIYVIFMGFCVVLVLACVRWQIVKAEDFQNIADGRVYSSELDSLRGSIYANDGSTLAYSEPRFDMFVWMDDLDFFEEKGIQTREEFITKVAENIDTNREELKKLIDGNVEKGIKWFPIARSLTADQWRDISALKTDKNPNKLLQGFIFQYTSERVYPENKLASHLIGLTLSHKDDIYGVGGIEEFWNGDLNPRKGIVIEEQDAIGQAIASSLVATVEPQAGSSIYTSIDKKLQQIIQDELKKGVERFESKSGTAIVMDPKTGEIMAMANYPDYNPNLREEEAGVYTNIALSQPYEFGSVGKVFTIAAAVDMGLIESNTLIMPNGHDGCVKFTDELGPLCTWDKKPQGPLTTQDCFSKSDNICLFEISKMMAEKDFHGYLKNFGVGQPTGIDIAGESIGHLKQASDWNIGDTAAFSYGHGYLVNTVQAIDAVSAIPNRGIRMRPRIVNKVVKGDGEVRDFEAEAITSQQRIISENTAEIVGNMMHQNYLNDIKDYEHWYADLKNYNIGWKSGSALIADQYGYTDDIYATQVGFDMSPERKFIMLIKLEKPKGGQLSFYNSRILWLDTFRAIKDYLQVPRK